VSEQFAKWLAKNCAAEARRSARALCRPVGAAYPVRERGALSVMNVRGGERQSELALEACVARELAHGVEACASAAAGLIAQEKVVVVLRRVGRKLVRSHHGGRCPSACDESKEGERAKRKLHDAGGRWNRNGGGGSC
jgi:hypothetical protein